MVKIFIDPGHGGSDPGAVAYGLKEKNLTLTIAKYIRDYLKEYNCSVKMSRTGDKTLSLSQRTNDANRWGADFFLSVHINAGKGTGYEDYIYNGVSNTSKASRVRDIVHGEVAKVLKQYKVTNRGKKKANFHVVRESRMPAMLSETLFIDTSKDARLLKDNKFLKAIGQAHARGIVKAFKLKGGKASVSKSSKSKTSTKKSSSKTTKKTGKSISKMAQEVIAGKHGNGHAQRSKSLGISASEYAKVRAEVNRRLTGKAPKKTVKKTSKSISQMATEVIRGDHGVGHAKRRKSLGVDKATYEKVRREVNRRLK